MENRDEQLIEAFLEGSLSGEELQQFEARLQREPELLAQVNLYKEVDQRLEDFHKEALKTEWKQFVNDNPAKPKSGSIVTLRTAGIIGVAATLLLLLWFGPLNDMLLKQSPYDNYFAHLPRDNANLSGSAVDGKKAYDELNYKQAYSGLLQEVADGADSLNLIYASVAAIGSQQAEKAIPILAPLVDAPNWQAYQAEIQWYLALAYLQEENLIQAQELLNNLTKEENQYTDEAAQLLEQTRQ